MLKLEPIPFLLSCKTYGHWGLVLVMQLIVKLATKLIIYLSSRKRYTLLIVIYKIIDLLRYIYLFLLLSYILPLSVSAQNSPPSAQLSAVKSVLIQPLTDKQRQLLKFKLEPAQNWRFSYFNETVFNSKMVVVEAGNKANPPLLLVHGLGELAMQDWFSVIPTLAENYYVIAVDLPGFGNSESPQGRYSPHNYAAVLAQVVELYSARPVTVIGHSMGGAVSLSFAGLYPQQLNKLVLVDAAGVLQKVAFLKPITNIVIEDSWLPKFVRTKLAQLNDFTTGLIELGAIDSYFSDLLQRSDSTWNALMGEQPNMNAALSLVEQDYSNIVANLNTQTYIIWGERDNIAPLRTAKVLQHRLANSELMTIAQAGHVPMKSATAEFLALLNHALETPVVARKEQPHEVVMQSHLICKDRHSQTFSGHYKKVLISGCNNILLKDMTAQSIAITDSLVRLENITITASDLGLEIVDSVVEATNVTINARNGVELVGARFDGAGVEINATALAMTVKTQSNIIFSLSKITSGHFQGNVHQAFELQNRSVDEYLQQAN